MMKKNALSIGSQGLIVGLKKISGAMSAARILSILAIGASLTMAQQPAGTIRAWGSNSSGQLGDGLSGNSPVPQSVEGLSGVIAVAAGFTHSLALKSDGSVFAWGKNDFGQLGAPNIQQTAVPVPVSGFGPGSGVIAIAAGFHQSMALKSDGSVWTWGSNSNGELGIGGPIGNPANSPVPVPVSGLGSGSGVIAISAGSAYSMALKSDGSILAWGADGAGQLGDGTTTFTDKTVPVGVSGLGSGSGVIAISAGNAHSMALKSDGSVASWGFNFNGQLGNGTQTKSSTPIGVSGLGSGAGVIAISAGGNFSLALKSDGSVLAWGNNFTGQLGDGTPADKFTPVAVSGIGSGSGVVAITASQFHGMALKSDGSALAWGDNETGELGDGTLATRFTPVQVSSLNGVVALGPNSSANHSLAIVQPVAAFSAASLSFGDQLVGTLSASQMIAIQNKGQDPLVIDSLSLSGAAAGDFKVSAPPTPFTVPPGASTALSVAFSPTAAFARLATLLIDSNAFQAPQFVALSGNGLVQADIAVGLGASPTPVRNGGNLTYSISVKNLGPTPAPAVVMNDALPAGAVLVSSRTTQGTCLTPGPGTTGIMTCNLGTLNSGAAATITVVVTVNSPGGSTLVNTASAIAGAPDPNLGNNSVTVVTPVFGSKH